jgi:homoserine kinase
VLLLCGCRLPQYPQFLVWVPQEELATKKRAPRIRDNYSRADAVFNVSRASLLLAALSTVASICCAKPCTTVCTNLIVRR